MNYNLAEYWEDEEFLKNDPKRLPMRKRVNSKGKLEDMEDHYYHGLSFWKDLEHFFEGHIGLDFDYVFSKFCIKFPKRQGKYNTREEFLNEFNRKYWDSEIRAKSSRYYIDENNKLRKNKF